MSSGDAESYPVGSYGKRLDVEKDFGLLAVDPEFPSDCRDELLELAKDFRWRSDSTLPLYDPCFALIPRQNAAWLAVRFLDAGRDSAGRLHTLRIEAVYLPSNSKMPPDLRALLHPDGWPPFDPSAPPATRIRFPLGARPMSDPGTADPPATAVLVKHAQAEYVGTRFAVRSSGTEPLPVRPAELPLPVAVGSARPPASSASTGSQRKRSDSPQLIWASVALASVAFAALLLLVAYKLGEHSRDKEFAEKQAELSKSNDAIESLKREKDGLESERSNLRDQRAELLKANSTLTSEKAQLTSDNANLKGQLRKSEEERSKWFRIPDPPRGP